MDYPFSFVEMRMKPNDKGEGRLLVATAVDVKNGRLERQAIARKRPDKAELEKAEAQSREAAEP